VVYRYFIVTILMKVIVMMRKGEMKMFDGSDDSADANNRAMR